MVFIDDEAIRSLVAQEMLWSGNFLVPTMHGDAYLNKPPLWNWVLALSFWLHGGSSEWAARLPTVIGLIGFAFTTWHFSRKYFPDSLAIIHALTVITCGRMLFWDSMLALIDVTFSWAIYTQIMLLYHYGRQDRWWAAFGWSYLLTAVGFLLKGLPAVVFQGLSVLALLGWCKAWRQFVRPAHLLSGVGCLLLLAAYYLPYGDYVDLAQVGRRLFIESGKRTPVAFSWGETLGHLVAFPFEMAYHFLPWTLLLVYLLRRGSWRQLRTNDFAAFMLVVFLVNLPVYWLSPEVYPRYLLMLFPLLFGSLLWLHYAHKKWDTLSYRGLRYLLLGAMTLVALAIPFIPLVPRTEIVAFRWVWSLGLGGVAGGLAWLAWRHRPHLLLIFCCFLLLLRIVFNVFILPPRAAGDVRGLAVRDSAERVAAVAGQDRLRIFRFTLIEPATGYYLSRARGHIVRRSWDTFLPNERYIGSPYQYPGLEIDATDSLYLRHLNVKYPVGYLVNPGGPAREQLQDGMGSGMPIE